MEHNRKTKLRWAGFCTFALMAGAAVALEGVSAPLMRAAPPLSAPTTAPAVAAVANVEIDNFAFKPKDLTVKVGETVTWVNHDDVPHTATMKGQSPEFDSKMLDSDEKFSFTFKNAGIYTYYCKVHPHMTGMIVVK